MSTATSRSQRCCRPQRSTPPIPLAGQRSTRMSILTRRRHGGITSPCRGGFWGAVYPLPQQLHPVYVRPRVVHPHRAPVVWRHRDADAVHVLERPQAEHRRGFRRRHVHAHVKAAARGVAPVLPSDARKIRAVVHAAPRRMAPRAQPDGARVPGHDHLHGGGLRGALKADEHSVCVARVCVARGGVVPVKHLVALGAARDVAPLRHRRYMKLRGWWRRRRRSWRRRRQRRRRRGRGGRRGRRGRRRQGWRRGRRRRGQRRGR
mmetsp:Transcript_8676/g.25796  ORF Transcript_8676/g.25796 Transcript_8676/m.25796 type:complete len:262 (+) Transcript_8676:70-855(+)